jgi:class 3 adenylate cyclase
MVLELEAGAWKVAQIHFSMPVVNKKVFGIETSRTLADLLASMDNESESAAREKEMVGTVTLVFTDVVGSTALSQSMGDQDWSDLITDHFHSVRTIVEGEKGRCDCLFVRSDVLHRCRERNNSGSDGGGALEYGPG